MTQGDEYSLVFSGLKEETRRILEALDVNRQYGSLINFDSLDEAIAFIEKRRETKRKEDES